MVGFSRSEYACKCGCGFDTVDYELDTVMDEIRKHFGKRVFINRGTSCVEHNDRIQLKYNSNYLLGSSTSQHLIGKACDFFVEDIKAETVYNYLDNKYPNKFGIGKYNNRTHIDVRRSKARWDKSVKQK